MQAPSMSGDGRIRQRSRSAATRSRPRLTSLRRQARVGLGAAQLLQVGAGDEHAGLAAAKDQAAQVGAAGELR